MRSPGKARASRDRYRRYRSSGVRVTNFCPERKAVGAFEIVRCASRHRIAVGVLLVGLRELMFRRPRKCREASSAMPRADRINFVLNAFMEFLLVRMYPHLLAVRSRGCSLNVSERFGDAIKLAFKKLNSNLGRLGRRRGCDRAWTSAISTPERPILTINLMILAVAFIGACGISNLCCREEILQPSADQWKMPCRRT